MRILLTNDDGIDAPGIEALRAALSPLAEVVLVAPDGPRNAVGRSFSLDQPVSYETRGPGRYALRGSPVDCVYFALHHLMIDAPPDLVFSGINSGANLAQDVTYSGTVGAGLEAVDQGLPAAAISQVTRRGVPLDFAAAARFAAEVVLPLLRSGSVPLGVLLNVNLPAVPRAGDGPVAWTYARLGRHRYHPQVSLVENPRGKRYYWLGGGLRDHEEIPGSDCVAIAAGLATITPIGLDLTHEPCLGALRAASPHASEREERG